MFANWIISITDGFNIATATLSSMVGSVLTSDFYYFASTVGVVFTSVVSNADLYGVIGFIMQSIYYLMMIFAPTSVALIIGLYYLNIPTMVFSSFKLMAPLCLHSCFPLLKIISVGTELMAY